MDVIAEKITNLDLLHRANRSTTGHDSSMSLAMAYRFGHSPIRTQLFWVECTDIPLFVASQFVRSHVGVQFFQRSKRPDRGGADFGKECEALAERAGTIFATGTDFATEYEHRSVTADSIRLLPREFDRYAPTDLAFIINAEALINLSHKRLCGKASKETREVFAMIMEAVSKCDPDLAKHFVATCVFRNGICPEPHSCRWVTTELGRSRLKEYQKTMKYNPE
ncbi:MAG: FAD-dependent thymidylate synthase [Bacteroides sp.]|nr:FAD-dependent thymidylate synthase [Bacteroides sp.]